jgi:hypothetical protein
LDSSAKFDLDWTRLAANGQSTFASSCDIDSNGRTNFFTRWWNQPELELGDFRTFPAELHFSTPNGTTISKELRLVEIGVRNSGNDDAFHPEIRVNYLAGEKAASGFMSFKKASLMLEYCELETPSNDPTEHELAVTFLRKGLQSVPLIGGGTAHYIVFGFVFRNGEMFHFASEDAISLVSLPVRTGAPMSFRLRAKARNSGLGLLCERALLIHTDYESIGLSLS